MKNIANDMPLTKKRELFYRSAQKQMKLPGVQNKVTALLGDVGTNSFLNLSENF